jgi:hypothetical protein
MESLPPPVPQTVDVPMTPEEPDSTVDPVTTMESPPLPVPTTVDVSLTPEEPDTTVDPVTPEAPTATSFTIYIPVFLEEYSLSTQSLEQQKNKLLKKDWLTTGLIAEIETLFPTCSEIQKDKDNK